MDIQDLIDDAKCYETIRAIRWSEGMTCPRCCSASVIKNGRDETQPDRRRHLCHGWRRQFSGAR